MAVLQAVRDYRDQALIWMRGGRSQSLVHSESSAPSPLVRPSESPKRKGALSLKANIAWTLAGNLVYTGCQWGVSMAIAKLGSPEALGQFSLGLAIAAPLFMSFGLQLRGIQATDARRDFSFADYLTLRVIMSTLAMGIILTLACLSRVLGWYDRSTVLVIVFVGAAKVTESMSDIFFGLFQQNEQMNRIAKSSIVKGVLSLALLAVTLAITNSIVWASATLTISWGLVLLLRDVPNGALIHREQGLGPVRLNFDRPVLWRLFRTSLPLGIMLLLISIGPVIPRFFIASSLSLYDLGIYSAIAYIMMAGQTVVAAVGQAASPRLSQRAMAGDRGGYLRLLFLLCGLGGAIGIVGIVVALFGGELVLRMMYSREYAVHNNAFVIVMAAAALQYIATFIEYGVMAARVFKQQVIPASSAVVATLIASYALIPTYGITGACWTLLIGQLVTVIGRGMVLLFTVRRVF